MENAEREARILQYWKAVELFSPQKVPRLNLNSRSEPVFRAGGETPLPWDTSQWFRPPEAGHKWRFTAYCGLYKLGRVRAYLERKFGRDPKSFDRRPDGESCLFALQVTGDGRPLLDTFVLASCPWAIGRLKDPGPTVPAWIDGFEAAAKEESLRIAERFAIREDDEIGRELNKKPGVHVGRPIQPNDLETEIERIADSLCIAPLLQVKEVRLAARQVNEKFELAAESDDFLNSFFLRDLERVASEAARSNSSAALSRFLSPEQDVRAEERCDVRASTDSLWQYTSPQLVPPGHWPAPPNEPLYFSQQFAVNAAVDALENRSTQIFGINGPPGTGKTTLLREIVASVVVRRAQALAKLQRPERAFAGPEGNWTTEGYERRIFLWREELLGFEIVVASSNNRAVENVTLEIPAARAADRDYAAQADYFADFATRLLSEQKRTEQKRVEQKQPNEAWALIAARLGSKKNRRRFRDKFWFDDKEAPKPRSRSDDGFQKYLQYLQTFKSNPAAWKKAVASFQAALDREKIIREERIAAWKALEAHKALTRQLTDSRSKLGSMHASALEAAERAKTAEDFRDGCQNSLYQATNARRDHRVFKPAFVDALFTMGGAYREWREKDLHLAAAIDASETRLKQACAACDEEWKSLHQIEHEITNRAKDIAAREDLLACENQRLEGLRGKLGRAFPAIECWATNPELRELSSPWADETWNRTRTQVFIEALHLHRTFVECLPHKIRKNLHAAMDILGGKVSPEADGKALQSAWATLFFLIPVVSTTFASFDRLFSHCGRESLGWLLIDEAGQATPQSAAGALWRSKRAVIVGDPRQLEPIVSLPFTAQQALRAHFGVEETWLPSRNSAQTLADRVSRFGTRLQSEDSEESIWVGSPLRVHRRCEKPMFQISNEIAYSGQMVYDTQEISLSLPPSRWIEVVAGESDDHWIPAEGIVLEILLTDLFRSGVSPTSILLISPFRAVARKVREIASRHGIAQAGTIHISQGKEADIVILILGGDPRRLGAKDWASEKPNLLNVAVTRAKRRLYIIGNREEWRQYPNFSDASALLTEQELYARSTSSSS